MKKLILLSLLGILSFTGFLLAGVPASVVWQVAQEQRLVPSNINLSGLDGTVWEGSAQSVSISGEKLPKTSWKLLSRSLPEQKLLVDIQTGHGRSDLFVKGQLSWDGDQVQLTRGKGRASRDQIQQWLQLPYPVEVDGSLSLSVAQLTVQNGRCKALKSNGRVRQAEARTPFGEVELGDVQFDLSCNGNRLKVVAQQNSNDLTANANITVDMRGRYTVNGSVKPQAELDESFRNSLAFLGKTNARGEYALKARGTLR